MDPAKLRSQRLEALDKIIDTTKESIEKVSADRDTQRKIADEYHAVLDKALATANTQLTAYEQAIVAAKDEAAVEQLDKVLEATGEAIALASADLAARKEAAKEARATVKTLEDERSEASKKRDDAIKLAEEATALHPQLEHYLKQLTALLPGWKAAEQALTEATTAAEAARAAYTAACDATNKTFAERIAKASATLAELQAPFVTAGQTPNWAGKGVTCSTDSVSLVEASYCRLGDYLKAVDKTLERRAEGWRGLDEATRAIYPVWPTEVVVLDNLSVALHELVKSSERFRGLMAQAKGHRTIAADL